MTALLYGLVRRQQRFKSTLQTEKEIAMNRLIYLVGLVVVVLIVLSFLGLR